MQSDPILEAVKQRRRDPVLEAVKARRKPTSNQSSRLIEFAQQVPTMLQSSLASEAVGALDLAAGALADRGRRAGDVVAREFVAPGSTREGYKALLDSQMEPQAYQERIGDYTKAFVDAQPGQGMQLARAGARFAEQAVKSRITVGNEPNTPEWWGRQIVQGFIPVAQVFGAGAALGPAGSGAVGFVLSASEVARAAYEEAKASGQPESTALEMGFEAAGKYAPTAAILEAIAPGAARGGKSMLARGLRGAAGEVPTEAAQTVTQELAVSDTTGVPVKPGQLGRAAVAGTVGGIVGFGAGAFTPRPGRPMLSNPKLITDYVQQNPQGAALVAAKAKPTQADFKAAGIQGEFRARQRERIADGVREQLQSRPADQPQAPANTPAVEAATPFVSAQPETPEAPASAFDTASPSTDSTAPNPSALPQRTISPETATVPSASTAGPEVSGAIGAASAKELESPPVSVKNAFSEWQRESIGAPERDTPETRGFEQLREEGLQTLKQNPKAGRDMVEKALGGDDGDGAVALSDRENAVLGLHRTQLNNEIKSVSAEMTKADRAGDDAAFKNLSARHADLTDDLYWATVAAEKTGTEQSRALGSRRGAFNEDMTLADMEVSARAVRGGRQLTPEESSRVKELHGQIEELKQRLAEAASKKDESELNAAVESEFKRTAKGEQRQGQEVRGERETPQQVIESQAKEADDFASLVKRLVRAFVREGVDSRDKVMAATHDAIKTLYPEATPRDVNVAFTDYGNYKNLSKDPEDVLLRQYRGELQQLLKIEDMASGKAPLATGMERPTPGDVWRGLTKIVNNMKRIGGFTVTDPAKQLKTALDAVKTRLRNQITDLGKQIQTREKIVKKKTELQYDEEATLLRKRRDELKQEFDAIFGTKGLTDAQRLQMATRAAEKSLAEYERRIAEGDFSEKQGKPPVKSAELDALRAKRDAAKARYEELKSLDPASQVAAEARKLAALKRHLTDRIEKLTERRAKKDYAKRPPKQSSRWDSEVADLQKSLHALNKGFMDELQRARNIERWRAETAMFKGEAQSGEFIPVPKREPKKLNEEERRAKFDRDQAKRVRDERLEELTPKTRLRSMVAGLFSLPRQLMTTGELSVVARQGFSELFAHPISTIRTVAHDIASAVSATAAQRRDMELYQRKNAPLYHDVGLRIVHPEQAFVGGEIALTRTWAEKMPIIAQFNRFSRIFLNDIRAKRFDRMLYSRSIDPYASAEAMQQAKQLAMYVNESTGGGGLGGFEPAAQALNQYLFSARFATSRFQLLLGHSMWGADAATRKVIAKEYVKQAIGVVTFYSLAAAAGAEIGDDPLSSDFGKIVVGRTRVDPMAGLIQPIVLGSRLAAGARTDSKGRTVPIRNNFSVADGKVGFGQPTARDLLQDFVFGKFAPVPSMAVSALSQQTPVGQPVGAMDFIPLPITWKDIAEAAQDQGVDRATAMALAAFFGAGLQTYKTR